MTRHRGNGLLGSMVGTLRGLFRRQQARQRQRQFPRHRQCIRRPQRQLHRLRLRQHGRQRRRRWRLQGQRRASRRVLLVRLHPHQRRQTDRPRILDLRRRLPRDLVQQLSLALMRQWSIAEGVETKAQANLLQRLGCGHARGYYFGRPNIGAGDAPAFGRPDLHFSVLGYAPQRPRVSVANRISSPYTSSPPENHPPQTGRCFRLQSPTRRRPPVVRVQVRCQPRGRRGNGLRMPAAAPVGDLSHWPPLCWALGRILRGAPDVADTTGRRECERG